MLLFELDFEEVSKKKLRECWSQLCRIRCMVHGVRPVLRLGFPEGVGKASQLSLVTGVYISQASTCINEMDLRTIHSPDQDHYATFAAILRRLVWCVLSLSLEGRHKDRRETFSGITAPDLKVRMRSVTSHHRSAVLKRAATDQEVAQGTLL